MLLCGQLSIDHEPLEASMLIELGLLDLGFSSLFLFPFQFLSGPYPTLLPILLAKVVLMPWAGGDLLANGLLVESLIPFLIPSRFRIL